MEAGRSPSDSTTPAHQTVTVATLDNPLCERCRRTIVHSGDKSDETVLRVTRALTGCPAYVIERGAGGELVSATNVRTGKVLNKESFQRVREIHRRSHRCPGMP